MAREFMNHDLVNNELGRPRVGADGRAVVSVLDVLLDLQNPGVGEAGEDIALIVGCDLLGRSELRVRRNYGRNLAVLGAADPDAAWPSWPGVRVDCRSTMRSIGWRFPHWVVPSLSRSTVAPPLQPPPPRRRRVPPVFRRFYPFWAVPYPFQRTSSDARGSDGGSRRRGGRDLAAAVGCPLRGR
jgi:hypothetical protein